MTTGRVLESLCTKECKGKEKGGVERGATSQVRIVWSNNSPERERSRFRGGQEQKGFKTRLQDLKQTELGERGEGRGRGRREKKKWKKEVRA